MVHPNTTKKKNTKKKSFEEVHPTATTTATPYKDPYKLASAVGSDKGLLTRRKKNVQSAKPL